MLRVKKHSPRERDTPEKVVSLSFGPKQISMNTKTFLTASLSAALVFSGFSQKTTLNCPNLNGETVTIDLSQKPTATYLYESPYDPDYAVLKRHFVSYDPVKEMITIRTVTSDKAKNITEYSETIMEKPLINFANVKYEADELRCLAGFSAFDYKKAITIWTCYPEKGKQKTEKSDYAPFYFKTKADAEAFAKTLQNAK